jgi:SAM-dependent methyltransferase
MRAAIAPPARALQGRAEATGLPAASADGVTVAQAFHWFDGPRALAEIHRVLRPGGVLALIWNRRRMDDEINQRTEAIIAPHRGRVPAHRNDSWREALAASPHFGPVREEQFANEQLLDAGGLADRFGSISFVATMERPARDALLAEVRALAGGGAVTLRYVVELQLATRLG